MAQQFQAYQEWFKQYVHIEEPTFQFTILVTILCPLIWNVVARNEYRHSTIQSILCQSKYAACYLLTVWIFCFSGFRDYLFHQCLAQQPHFQFFVQDDLHEIVGISLLSLGQILVWSSFARLGITGTFLGDYCGIYMDERVTGFPFNVTNNPMYNGSTLSFIGHAIWHKSLAGLVLAIFIFVVYRIALLFEEPFTDMIYKNKAEREAAQAAKSK